VHQVGDEPRLYYDARSIIKTCTRSRNYTADDTGFTVPVGHTSGCVKFISTEHTICGLNTSKGKAIPLQVCTGPEGSSRLRLTDFKTNGT